MFLPDFLKFKLNFMNSKKIKPELNSEWYLAGQIHSIFSLVKVGNTNDPAWGILPAPGWGILMDLGGEYS